MTNDNTKFYFKIILSISYKNKTRQLLSYFKHTFVYRFNWHLNMFSLKVVININQLSDLKIKNPLLKKIMSYRYVNFEYF